MREGWARGGRNLTDLRGRLPKSHTIWSPFVIQAREDGGKAESQEYL